MSKPVEDWELSAFVDGDLPSRRMAEIEAEAERSPEIRKHLSELLADHRALADAARAEEEASGELPPRLARLACDLSGELRSAGSRESSAAPKRLSQLWRQISGLAAAGAIGWAAASWAAPHDDPLATFIDEAAEIHRVTALAPTFSREASTSVIDSIGVLFARDMAPPDLTATGFVLTQIDVAATDVGPVAVFVYADPEARRVSLVMSTDSPILDALGRGAPGQDTAAPRVTSHDGLAVSYGRRESMAYALVGSIPEPRAQRLAERVALSALR